MNVAIAASAYPSRNRPLLYFAFLQLLDWLTTLAVFSRGGYELNPIVRGLLPFTGPVVGVLVSKSILLFLVWRFSQRNWILYFGNVLYSAIVAWNLLMFVLGMYIAS